MAQTFETTSWSLVLSAKDGSTHASRAALDTLCRIYWRPLYAQILRRGYPREDARDLTQEFFTRLLEYDFVGRVHRERGRLRTFLLASLDHFLADDWKQRQTQRRGGSAVPLSLDFEDAETRLGLQALQDHDPRREYDRQWARTLLASAMARLEGEFSDAGKSTLFTVLQPCLLGRGGDHAYKVLSQRVGLSESGLKVAVYRMRQRYGSLLREEVARTVENTADVDEELRYLIEMVGGSGA